MVMESAIFDSLGIEKVKGYNYNRVLLCGGVLVICWCSSRLPLALQWISALLAGHVFSFLLSNAIILTLLANSAWLSAAPNSSSEILRDAAAEEEEEVEMIPARPNPAGIDGGESSDLEFRKALRRTKSEVKYCSEEGDCKGAALRRSETCCREVMSAGYGGEEEEEEMMSNEEFQRAIEAFIAKQLKFRRQESISGVVQTSCS